MWYISCDVIFRFYLKVGVSSFNDRLKFLFFGPVSRQIFTTRNKSWDRSIIIFVGTVLMTFILILGHFLTQKLSFLYDFQDEIAERAIKLSAREKRFIKFASVEYDGQIYMTPQDFLESVVEQEPRRK